MAALDFQVPQHPEDLEVAKAGKVFVQTVLDVETCDNIDAVIDSAYTQPPISVQMDA